LHRQVYDCVSPELCHVIRFATPHFMFGLTYAKLEY